VLLVCRQRKFRAHGFETCMPAFLLETLRERGVGPLDLDDSIASDDLRSAFDVDHMTTEALLFQTGYLTIVGEQREEDETLYRLGYPNREVRQSLNRSLLRAIGWTPHKQLRQRSDLRRSLQRADFASLERHFRGLFASIPYNWHTGNDIARYEGYWASVMYGSFHALGLDVTVEDASAAGCLDMAVRAYGQLYLFEFKVTEQAGRGAALKQLEARGYAHKYVGRGEPVHLVGVEFSGEQRRLERFDVLRAAAAG